jgi:zinc protease
VDPDALKREIELILRPAAELLCGPEREAREALLALAFEQHRLRRPGSGSEQILRGIDAEAIAKHYKTRYSPSRMTLSVSGDISAAELLNDAVKWFQKAVADPSKPEIGPPEPSQSGFRYRGLRGDVSRARILLGFHTAPLTAADYPAVEVLRALAAMGRGSALEQSLRERKKVITRADAKLISLPDVGFLTIELELDPADIDKAELAAFTELEILKQAEPDPDDLERARVQLEMEFWNGLQTVEARSRALAWYEEVGDWKRMNQHLDRLRQVKGSDVMRVAAKYLRLENCSLIEYLPAAAEPRSLQADTVVKSFQQLLEAAVNQEVAEREKETKPDLDLPEPPGAFKFTELRYSFQKASILRGPELFIREDHTLPVIHMGFFYPGGKLLETKGNSGITSLMVRSMLRGTTDLDPARLHRQLELYGGHIAPVVEDDYFGFAISVLSRNVEPALGLIAKIVRTPKFDDEEIQRQKRVQIGDILGRKHSPLEYAFDRFHELIFKDHPYGLAPDGLETAVTALTGDAVRQWYKETVEHRKPVVVIIGDTQGTNLAGYFVRNFSGSRFQDVKLTEEFAKAPEAKVSFEETRERKLSLVLLGVQAPPQADEDSYTVAVLERLLAGAGSRLPEQVAGEVSVRYEPRLRSGTMVVYAMTSPENEEMLLARFQEALRSIFETTLLYKDYRSSVNAAVGAYQIRQQARFSQIAFVMQNVLSGKGIEGLQENTALLQETAQEDLADVARRIFNMEKSVTVRLHGRS